MKNAAIKKEFINLHMRELVKNEVLYSKDANKIFDNFFDSSDFCICKRPHRAEINALIFEIMTSNGFVYDNENEKYLKP